MGSLDGRVALVSGGGTGIGRGIVEAFVEEGARVAIVGRRRDVLEAAAEEIGGPLPRGGDGCVLVVSGDVSNKLDVEAAVARTVAAFGSLSILVNNAGVAVPGPLAEIVEKDVDAMIDIDLKGPILLTQAALVELKKAARAAGDASILNISSSVTLHALANYSVYSATKAALDMLTRCWARELAEDRVRSNAISPGIVDTPVFETMMPKEAVPAFLESFNEQVPLGRVGQPVDIARMAVFLSGPQSRWTTGAVIPLDGGLSLTS